MATGAIALAACGGGGSGSSSGGSSLEKFQKDGVTIGYADEKPYDYLGADGQVTGMAPELGKVILKNMGITDITWKKVAFEGLVPGLQAGRFDMTMAAASITPKRAEAVSYTDPVYCVEEALGVKKGNPLGLSDYNSIKSNPKAKLAVESGATEQKYAMEVGIPDSQLVVVSSNSALVASVKTGRADAFSLTGITVRSLVADQPELEALPGFNPVIDGNEQLSCGAPQFRKNETALRDAYNDELHKLQQADQVYSTIKDASPDGDAFTFAKSQFDEAKKHTFEELSTAAG